MNFSHPVRRRTVTVRDLGMAYFSVQICALLLACFVSTWAFADTDDGQTRDALSQSKAYVYMCFGVE